MMSTRGVRQSPPPAGFPSFEDFFEAVTGHTPYHWQSVVAAAIAEGSPPSQVTVPTGMGKTSLMLCWIWALAQDLARCSADPAATRRVPLRYVVVVDRRLLVDEMKRVAQLISDALNGTSTVPAIATIADSLRQFVGDDEEILDVRVLRGGLPTNPENTRLPATPAIILGTVDLIGSRLLWRGYGVSSQRRAIEAAIIGTDSLLVLDEAHIAQQLLHTLRTLDLQLGAECLFDGSVPPRRVVVATATPTGGSEPFDWDAEIRRNPGIAWRLANRRGTRVEVVSAPGNTGDAAMEGVARSLEFRAREATLIYCNTRRTAKKVAAVLAKNPVVVSGTHRLVLLVGGMPRYWHITQEADTAGALTTLDAFRTGAPERESVEHGLIIVATQTLEVGADIDADRVITPVASPAALDQRKGRGNRVGARSDGELVIIVGKECKPEPVYGETAADLGRALLNRRPSTVGELDDMLRSPEVANWTPAERQPATMPRFVHDSYVHTAGSPHEAPVNRWLRFPEDPRADVNIVFRDSLTQLGDEALVEHLTRFAPVPEEVWPVPVSTASDLISGDSKAHRRSVLLDPTGAEPPHLAPSKEDLRPGWFLVVEPRPDALDILTAGGDLIRALHPTDRPFQLVPYSPAGDHVVAPDSDPEVEEPEPDHSAVGSSHLTAAQGGDIDAAVQVAKHIFARTSGIGEAFGLLANALSPTFIATLLPSDANSPAGWIEISRARAHSEYVFPKAVELSEHQEAVARRACRWATRLRLPQTVVADIITAARWHDQGKTDPRIQSEYRYHVGSGGVLSLTPPTPGVDLAKSTLPRSWWQRIRVKVGLPAGLRHEALSAQWLDQALASGIVTAHDHDLVRHLVLTHHGRFRGSAPAITGSVEEVPRYQNPQAKEWATRPDRFAALNAHYGPYTLALAESVVRLADWFESQAAATPPEDESPS